jgi:hypothetical protein
MVRHVKYASQTVPFIVKEKEWGKSAGSNQQKGKREKGRLSV